MNEPHHSKPYQNWEDAVADQDERAARAAQRGRDRIDAYTGDEWSNITDLNAWVAQGWKIA